jgi:hypothetical protein
MEVAEQILDGENMIKVHYMHVWKYHNKTMVQLKIYKNLKHSALQ